MKKALSLLLALTLIFAMAAPASAAYTGRFSRDGTYNDVAYLISAVCNSDNCRASISYADPDSAIELSVTVYPANSTSSLTYNSGIKYVSDNYSMSGREIDHLPASFKLLGTNIASVQVDPG